MEGNTLAQMEGPLGQVLIRFIGLSQARLDSHATNFISKQCFGYLQAGTQ